MTRSFSNWLDEFTSTAGRTIDSLKLSRKPTPAIFGGSQRKRRLQARSNRGALKKLFQWGLGEHNQFRITGARRYPMFEQFEPRIVLNEYSDAAPRERRKRILKKYLEFV